MTVIYQDYFPNDPDSLPLLHNAEINRVYSKILYEVHKKKGVYEYGECTTKISFETRLEDAKREAERHREKSYWFDIIGVPVLLFELIGEKMVFFRNPIEKCKIDILIVDSKIRKFGPIAKLLDNKCFGAIFVEGEWDNAPRDAGSYRNYRSTSDGGAYGLKWNPSPPTRRGVRTMQRLSSRISMHFPT
ncbi:hypothetical protein OE766_21560 [Pararhizobium sp. YC-54]|uniref:hypothetical protein n=1 Tax=Pararhizobium sp. YC-54 TaxID=2986920 RepID=UPI0021F75D5F|nr:hypothetical protein [Pararhizobium sp. YC-54]MCW0000822.1 hypothetical protein [Pararhizobium sp. YC-54]